MTNTNDLLTVMLKRAGVSEAKIKEGFNSGEWAEEVIEKLDGLMNYEAALQNTKLRNEVIGKTLGGIESKIVAHIRDNYSRELPEGAMTGILGAEKTSEKVIAALAALAKGKNNTIEQLKKESGVSEEYQRQITEAAKRQEDLERKLAEANDQLNQTIEQHEVEITKSYFNSFLAGKKLLGENELIQQIGRDHIISTALAKARIKKDDNGNPILINKITGQPMLNPQTQQPESVETFLTPIGAKLFAKADEKPAGHDQTGTGIPDPKVLEGLDPIAREAMMANRKNLSQIKN